MRMFLMGLLHRLHLLEPARDLFNWCRYIFSFKVRRDNAAYLGQGVPDGLPVPTPKLIHLIGGSYSIPDFIANGRHGADCIRRILEKNGIAMERFGFILDFGCGCGRVTRFWAGLKNTKVFGTDYNPELIAWCRENLKFGEFGVNGLSGRLDYPDNRFDFVYAISVFTHLPHPMQKPWLDELLRVTAPGGHLYITVLGTQHRAKMSADEWDSFTGGGMIVQWEGYPGTNICRVFHSEKYFRERLAAGVRVVDFVPGGAEDADRQDVFLLKKISP